MLFRNKLVFAGLFATLLTACSVADLYLKTYGHPSEYSSAVAGLLERQSSSVIATRLGSMPLEMLRRALRASSRAVLRSTSG